MTSDPIVKTTAYIPVSSELLADSAYFDDALAFVYAAMLRRFEGLCSYYHRNGDFCAFADGHTGTHVTEQGRRIMVVPYEPDVCECCGQELE